MSEILTKARELGQAIVDSEEFKALKTAEENQEKDVEAMELLKKYNEERKALAEEVGNGNVSEERLAEIRTQLSELFETVMSHPTIAAYSEAQQKFDSVVQQMNAILTYFITGEISTGCSGNCSGCSSCGQ